MAKLTRQEIKVLQLIAEGKSTKEISNQLAITFHTVEGYRKSILFKTGSRNMCEAVALGFKNRLLFVITAITPFFSQCILEYLAVLINKLIIICLIINVKKI